MKDLSITIGPHLRTCVCIASFLLFWILRVEEVKLSCLMETVLFHTLLLRVSCHTILTLATQAIFVGVVCLSESVSAAVTSLWTVLTVLPLFWTTNIFSSERPYEEGSLFLHQWWSLRFYMLNKNIMLHKIPWYGVPISAIWIALKININVNINVL